MKCGVDVGVVSLQGNTALELATNDRTRLILVSPIISIMKHSSIDSDLVSIETKLLDASKAGDLDTVKVRITHISNRQQSDIYQ